MKKVILFILLMIMFITGTNSFAMSLVYDGETHEYTAKPIKLIVMGETVNTEMPPIILNDRTLVPARDIFEKLGARVNWNEKYKQVYVMYGSKTIILTINSNKALINQISTELDVPAKIINDKTMIPAAFVAKKLGFFVNWNDNSRTVSISDKDTPVIPVSDKVVLGYATYYYTGDKSSYNSIVKNKEEINQVITHTYTVDGIGNLKGIVPKEQIKFAKDNNIKIQASVLNDFNRAVANELLSNSTNRNRLINNIVNELQKYGYEGVCIDLENIGAGNRANMTQFMKDLYGTLQPKGYSVSIAVPAKTFDDKTSGWQGAFDYKALAPYADQFIIMTYDEHYPQGTPGPIASAGWVEKVVKYAISVIPKEKILLGIAAYGYDWSTSGTKSYTLNKAYSVASQNNAQIKWDDISKSPYFEYVDAQKVKHTVWFENEQSIEAKLNFINNYDLQGVSIWALGYENQAYMDKITNTLQ